MSKILIVEDEVSIAELEKDYLELSGFDVIMEVMTEAAAHIHDEGFTAERYFLAHPEAAISKLSVELISNRYHLATLLAL